MFFRLLLLFSVVPLIELTLLVQLDRVIGLPATIGMVILTAILGAYLTRREGTRALRRYQEEARAGRPPTQLMLDGVLILVAGAVLLTPGLLTDAVGFSLLIPKVRAMIAAEIARRFQRNMEAKAKRFQEQMEAAAGQRPAGPDDVIDVEYERVD